ncbi:MAG: sugar-binding protein, partial [Bacteroidota bacterium]
VVKTSLTENGYSFEARIPLSSLGNMKFFEGKNYGFELALDNGDASAKRITQTRWANPYTEGFHLNPSLWGMLQVKSPDKNE